MNSRFGNPYPQQDDYLRDYNQKYDNHLNDLQNNGQILSDLEFRLDEERKNMKNVRQKLENDLDSEKQQRIEFQNKIIESRNEIQQKDNQIQELEYQLKNYMSRNDELEQEKVATRNDFIRGSEQYNQRFREFEVKNKQLNSQLQQNDIKFKNELENITKSHEKIVHDMTQTYKQQKEGAEAEIKSLKLKYKN